MVMLAINTFVSRVIIFLCGILGITFVSAGEEGETDRMLDSGDEEFSG